MICDLLMSETKNNRHLQTKNLCMKRFGVVAFLVFCICRFSYGETTVCHLNDSLLSQIGKCSSDAELLELYGKIAESHCNVDSIIKYATLESELAQKQNRPDRRADAFRFMGMAYSYQWDLDKAYEQMSQALQIYSSLNDTLNEARSCEWLGRLLSMRGANANAVGFLNRSLELYKQLGREDLEAGIYRLMGVQCLDYKVYDRAYEYFGRARSIDNQIGCVSGETEDLYWLGHGQLNQCMDEDGSLDQLLRAKADLMAAYNNADKIQVLHTLINIYVTMADVCQEQAKIDRKNGKALLDSSLMFINMGYKSIRHTGSSGYKMALDLRMARYQMTSGNYKLSDQILKRLEQADNDGNLTSVPRETLYMTIAVYYSLLREFEQVAIYARKVSNVARRKNNDGYLVNSTQTKIQTEFDEEMRQRDESDRERELIFKTRSQQLVTIIIITSLLIIILSMLVAVVYRSNVRRRRNNNLLNEQNQQLERQQTEILEQNKLLNQKTEQIQAQRDEIEGQRNYLSSQNKMISNANRQLTDSLLYAQKIQEASVPSQDMMNGFFGECLIFWRPLNIVSGDFYWAVQVGNYKFLAVADCTGHGVPGAFMSMLGISLLNDIVMHENVAKLTASRVLENLRAKLKDALRQTGRAGEAADGIDLAFCIFNTKSTQMQYAGAFRPLIIIRNGEIIEYKADKMPCGVYINESPRFTNNIIDLQSGDVLYMYSDGIADQFSGGTEMRKFTIRRLKEMLVEYHSKPFSQQKLLIAKTIDDWRKPPSGIGKQSSQVDDILLIGLRVK